MELDEITVIVMDRNGLIAEGKPRRNEEHEAITQISFPFRGFL